ncbi:MAG TPA: hypothetical protein VIG89_02045 [Candidatus Acidoferrales bacterium]
MDQKAAKHNQEAEDRAVAKLRKRIRQELENNEYHFGRICIEVFTQNGLITGSEAHVRETERYLTEKAAG